MKRTDRNKVFEYDIMDRATEENYYEWKDYNKKHADNKIESYSEFLKKKYKYEDK